MADASSPFAHLPPFAAGAGRDDEWAPWASGSPGRGGTTPSPTWAAAAPPYFDMGGRTESEPAPASPGAARGAKRARGGGGAPAHTSRSGARRPARSGGASPGGRAGVAPDPADAALASYVRALAAASDPPTMLALRDALYRLSRNTDAAARAGGVGAVSPQSLTARARAADRVVAAMLFAPTGVAAC